MPDPQLEKKPKAQPPVTPAPVQPAAAAAATRPAASGQGYAAQAAALSPRNQPGAPPADPLLQERNFADLFRSASKVRGAETNTIARGSLGNFITSVSFGALGDGCSAWADWAHSWVSQNGSAYGVVDYDTVHVTGMGNHNFVWVKFQSGREYCLDPWRDRENCVIAKSEYEGKYGVVKRGFGSAGELAGNYAKGASYGARALWYGRAEATRQDEEKK